MRRFVDRLVIIATHLAVVAAVIGQDGLKW
jgi:hypothetical protein